MTHNVFGLNYEMERVAEVIFAEDPDIIALQEYFPEQRGGAARAARRALPALGLLRRRQARQYRALLPRCRSSSARHGACSEAATAQQRTSQHPRDLHAGRRHDVLGADDPSRLAVPDRAAAGADRASSRSRSTRCSGPLIVVGDMNSTPWSYAMRGLVAATGMTRHDFNLVTYPLKFTLPMLTDDPLRAVPAVPVPAARPRDDARRGRGARAASSRRIRTATTCRWCLRFRWSR